MNRVIERVIGAVLIIALALSTVYYHDVNKKQQEKYAKAESKIGVLQGKLKAAETNGPEQLSKQANKFIKLLFDNSEKDPEAHKKAVLSLLTGKAYRELTDASHGLKTEATSLPEGMKSEAVIDYTTYNRISATQGKVEVRFDHVLTTGENESKTVNEAVVYLQYEDGQWKVHDYEIKPLF